MTEGLPKGLQEWANANVPEDKMKFKEGYWNQIMFIIDWITPLLFSSYDALTSHGGAIVISTHSSKSIILPVYQINLDNGLTFIMRYNFHDWKISISSPYDIDVDFMDLIDPQNTINSCYCEGFPDELVFGSYASSKQQFTIELGDKYKLYTFFYILSTKLGLHQK